MKRPDAEPRKQRKLVRQASLYSIWFLAAAAVVAIGGAALIALLLATQGMPFFRTWLVAAALLVLSPFLILVGNAWLRKRRGGGDSGTGTGGASGNDGG